MCIIFLCLADNKEFNVRSVSAALTKDLPPDRYCDLGLTLGLELVEIQKIEKDYPRDCNRHLLEIIQRWIDLSGSASWKTLTHKLMEMDEDTLANKIHTLHT